MLNRLVEMIRVDDNEYHAKNSSLSMKREHGLTPNGNPVSGRWVVRDMNGDFLDFDQYANDLAERHNMKLY